MSNSNKTVILDSGLNQVNNWGIAGTYFSIKYFLPVYDPSIDDKIHSSTQDSTSGTGTQVRPLSASVLSTQTSATIQGEKLWNANSPVVLSAYGIALPENVYTISTTDKYVITSATNIQHGHGYNINPIVTSGVSISGSSQSVGSVINLVGGIYTLSQTYSASNLTINSTGSNGTLFNGDIRPVSIAPNIALTSNSMLYPVKAFVPVNVSASDPTVDAGRYIVQLDSSAGDYRFNKIVFYLAKMNLDGTEDTSYIPTPFAQMVWEGTSKKQKSDINNSGVVWEGIIDLIFQRDSGANNLTYLNTDNWNYMSDTFGLSTVNNVKIFSSGIPANDTNDAKLEIYDNNLKQLKLAYDLDKYSYMWTDSTGRLNLSAVNTKVNNNLYIGNNLVIRESSSQYISANGTGPLYIKGDNGLYIHSPLMYIGEANNQIVFGSNSNVDFNSSATTFNYGVNFVEPVDFEDGFEVSGTSTFDGFGIFNNTASFNDLVQFEDLVQFNSQSQFNSSATFNNNIYSNEKLYLGNDFSMFESGSGYYLSANSAGVGPLYIDANNGLRIYSPVMFIGETNDQVVFGGNSKVTFNSSATEFNYGVDFDAQVDFNSTVDFYGEVDFLQYVYFDAPVSINAPLDISNTLSVLLSASLDSHTRFGSTTQFNGLSTFAYGALFTDPIYINDGAYFNSSASFENEIFIKSDINLIDATLPTVRFTSAFGGASNAQIQFDLLNNRFVFSPSIGGDVSINGGGLGLPRLTGATPNPVGNGIIFTSADDDLYYKTHSGLVYRITSTLI